MGEHILISTLPGRKRPALCVEGKGEIRILAVFKSQEAVQEYLSFKPVYEPKISSDQPWVKRMQNE